MSHHLDNRSQGPAISKAEIRALARQQRRDLADKDRRSLAIARRFLELSQYAGAETVLVYMHIRDEVRTTDLVTQALQTGKKVVVPYCVGDDLKLFLLADRAELSAGTLGIPEPKESLRSRAERQVAPEELDLLAVPGLAFDRSGGRVGHGRGYFDRLLRHLRPDACSIGLAFECQLFDRVPMDSHDVPLDGIVTEERIYLATESS